MQFHLDGMYRYASPEDLSAAIERARARLVSRNEVAMRCFVHDQIMLTVNLSFKSPASEWIPVLEMLATNALEGRWALRN